MSQERQEPMPITERELRHLTADLDELHHATLPAMHHELSEWAESAPGLHARLRALGASPPAAAAS